MTITLVDATCACPRQTIPGPEPARPLTMEAVILGDGDEMTAWDELRS